MKQAVVIVALIILSALFVYFRTREKTSTLQPSAIGEQISLAIVSPANNVTVSNGSISVSGKTNPSATVFINELETKANSQGVFGGTVALDEGENILVIVAHNDEGDSTEQELIVNYEPVQ